MNSGHFYVNNKVYVLIQLYLCYFMFRMLSNFGYNAVGSIRPGQEFL